MGQDDEPSDRQEPDGREERQEAIDRVEGYATGHGDFVIFDGENPVAWLLSDVYGIPVDAGDGEDDDADGDDE